MGQISHVNTLEQKQEKREKFPEQMLVLPTEEAETCPSGSGGGAGTVGGSMLSVFVPHCHTLALGGADRTLQHAREFGRIVAPDRGEEEQEERGMTEGGAAKPLTVNAFLTRRWRGEFTQNSTAHPCQFAV